MTYNLSIGFMNNLMSKTHIRNKRREAGFTIVELLIATTVFATVLVLITSGIIQVTSTFFKGDTESNTQQVAVAALNAVSQAVQFNGGTVSFKTTGSGDTICIGTEQFSYWPGVQITSSTANSGLIENTGVNCNVAGNPSTSGRQLLANNMRLSNLSVQCISSAALCASTTTGGQLYQIDIRVVYGNTDLLKNPTATDASCNGVISGQQFCAVSDISTIVSERI